MKKLQSIGLGEAGTTKKDVDVVESNGNVSDRARNEYLTLAFSGALASFYVPALSSPVSVIQRASYVNDRKLSPLYVAKESVQSRSLSPIRTFYSLVATKVFETFAGNFQMSVTKSMINQSSMIKSKALESKAEVSGKELSGRAYMQETATISLVGGVTDTIITMPVSNTATAMQFHNLKAASWKTLDYWKLTTKIGSLGMVPRTLGTSLAIFGYTTVGPGVANHVGQYFPDMTNNQQMILSSMATGAFVGFTTNVFWVLNSTAVKEAAFTATGEFSYNVAAKGFMETVSAIARNHGGLAPAFYRGMGATSVNMMFISYGLHLAYNHSDQMLNFAERQMRSYDPTMFRNPQMLVGVHDSFGVGHENPEVGAPLVELPKRGVSNLWHHVGNSYQKDQDGDRRLSEMAYEM